MFFYFLKMHSMVFRKDQYLDRCCTVIYIIDVRNCLSHISSILYANDVNVPYSLSRIISECFINRHSMNHQIANWIANYF